MSVISEGVHISVIVPTYNRAHLLGRAIQSVLMQSLGDFELIVVDDASSDNTSEVVKAFDDPRIVYICQEENGGAAAARNTAIRQANGYYVAFLDDDDEYLPAFLEQMQLAFANAPIGVGFGWCGVRVVKDGEYGEHVVREGVWQPSFGSRHDAYLAFLVSRRIGTNCGIVVRRACFDSIGLFDASFRKAEDTDLLIRLVRELEYLVVPRTLVKIHTHSGPRLTAYDMQMAEAYERIIGKHHETLAAHPHLAAELYYKAGWLHYHARNRPAGRRLMFRALGNKPWHLKSLIALVLFETLGTRAPGLHTYLSRFRAAVQFSNRCRNE